MQQLREREAAIYEHTTQTAKKTQLFKPKTLTLTPWFPSLIIIEASAAGVWQSKEICHVNKTKTSILVKHSRLDCILTIYKIIFSILSHEHLATIGRPKHHIRRLFMHHNEKVSAAVSAAASDMVISSPFIWSLSVFSEDFFSQPDKQTCKKRRGLGCVNSPLAARGRQEVGFTQPSRHLFLHACIGRCISPNHAPYMWH